MDSNKSLQSATEQELVAELKRRGYYCTFLYSAEDVLNHVSEATEEQASKWLEGNEYALAEMFGEVFMSYANDYAEQEIMNGRWEC